MSDLSNKCVLLKGLPPHFLQGDVEKVLRNGDFFSGVDKIQDHLERQNDKRWIVLFKTEEGWYVNSNQHYVTSALTLC